MAPQQHRGPDRRHHRAGDHFRARIGGRRQHQPGAVPSSRAAGQGDTYFFANRFGILPLDRRRIRCDLGQDRHDSAHRRASFAARTAQVLAAMAEPTLQALQQKAQYSITSSAHLTRKADGSALRAFDLLSFKSEAVPPSTRIENRRNFCFASCQPSVPKILAENSNRIQFTQEVEHDLDAFPMNFNRHRCVGRPCLFCNERKRLPQGRTSATARVFGSK